MDGLRVYEDLNTATWNASDVQLNIHKPLEDA
jgi:hypothetical protein